MNARLWLAVALVAAVGAAMPMSLPGVAAKSVGRGHDQAVRLAASSALQDGDDGGEPLLDLAAMVPGPDDLPDDGYAVSYSQSLTLAGYADVLNSITGGDRADGEALAEALADVGWRQWYELALSLPNEDDPDFYARTIFVQLAQYEDEAGAEAGYELLTGAQTAGGYEETRGGREIGDRFNLTRAAGTDNASGDPFRLLALVFQTEVVVARVGIVDWQNDSPPASEAAALGADLAERIEAVAEGGTPGFGPAMQRIEAEGQYVYFDWYRRLDGETRRDYTETADVFESTDEWFDDTGRIDIYTFYQEFPGEEESVYTYLATLQRFEDEDAAEAFVEDQSQAFAEEPASGYSNVELVDDAESFADQSAAVSFDYARSDDTVASGFKFYVQTEDVVVSLEVDGVPGVPLAAVEALVEGQLACLDAGACDGWAPPPDELGGSGAPGADDDEGDEGDEGPADEGDEAIEVRLSEVDDSGVRGTATLTADGDETEAAVELRGGEDGMLAVVQGGSCDDLDPAPVSDLEEVDENGEATLAIPVPLDDLLDEAHAIAVYASEDDLDVPPIACGEIEP